MKTIVGVLRGGASSEYDVSLQSGAFVLSELDRERYEPLDLFINRSGRWHRDGRELSPERALRGVDVAFNVLHGEHGENGQLQRMLDTFGMPYTGSGAYASALAYDKARAKEAVAPLGIKLARHAIFSRGESADIERQAFALFRTFPMPAMVKPVAAGSSVGTTLARDLDGLVRGLDGALAIGGRALVEEYVRGREATVGVVEGFRGQPLYPLLPIEIIPTASPFFDAQAKYDGSTREIVPGNFSSTEKEKLMDAAVRVHEALGLSHYSRSDFIVSKRGIYFLEANNAAAVGFTKESLMPKALRALGVKFSDFFSHVIELARATKRS